jgi:hypothetical protein
VKYELSSYIPADGILHSERREDPKSYSAVIVPLMITTFTALRFAAGAIRKLTEMRV